MVFSPVPELPFLPAPTGLYGFWKHYLNYLLSNKGGLFFLECNYDVKRTNILPTFYPHELLSWWAELRDVVDPDRGHEYILWNNREIMIEGKTVSVYRYYFDNGVIFTKDLLYEKTNTQSFSAMKEQGLKCYYDQILDIHFFTFSYTTGLSKISCQISIYYEQYNSCVLDPYFREFTAAINFPCSKSGLRIGENDVIFSKIPHGLKL